MKSPSSFIAITSEGGLLPADFLHELPDPKTSIEGVTPVAYHLAEGERLNEQINRSWHRLKGCWENFKKAVADKPATDPTTTDTRERWLFPLFQELGFGRLTAAKPIEVDGRCYPVSHGWNQVPIHLVGSHADLDCRTPGAIGAAKASPHSLVQSALNASEAHLWGIVSNGLNLRLLRDNVALTRLAYVEFDLQAMFDGDLYSEFFVLWLVCHQSRFEGEKPTQFWLERWKKTAEDKTLRALDDLYPGVKKAIAVLGAGLVSNRANVVLLEKLRTGRLSTQEFYKQVLRVIYRMLFLLVAEDRALLHVEDDSEAALKARRRYRDFYSLARLRALTLYRAGTPHPDLWQVFQLVTAKLGSDTGCPELALPPLGSFLWTAAQSTPDLLDSLISNRHFLEAVHALTFVQDGNVRRAVDYKNLGSEELGSVYQGLLEMHPRINADAGSFELDIAAGNERKTSGSYYTPDSLVQCLLDSALEPVIAERLAKAKTPKEKETALLSLKVCDKAAGSGHFIIRAGHRIARHLARVRSGEEEPSPAVYRTALRDVIGHCLYGVDINPMAVELCKVTLWLEALEPGKPLSFLDHHIRCGNSLLGTTPELISAGLPDDTFKPIEGDNPDACSSLKKLNKAQREGLRHLFIAEDTAIRERMHQAAAAIDEISDSRPEDIHRKEAAFRNAQQNYDFQKAWDLANLWCAAFVIKKRFADGNGGASVPTSHEPATLAVQPLATQGGLFGGAEELPKAKGKKTKAPSRASSEIPIGITTQHLRDFVAGGELPDGLLAEAKRLADQYQFFHFHLAFPEVFAQGGFDLSLGNPPWDTLSPDQREFFGKWVSGLRSMSPDEQQVEIDRLLTETSIAAEWTAHCRYLFTLVHFLKCSGVFTLYAPGNLGKGDFNIYRMFVEIALRRIREGGYACQVVPAGLYGGANASAIRKFMFDENQLKFLAGCENKGAVFFPRVHPQTWFALYSVQRGGRTDKFRVTFGVDSIEKAVCALKDAMELEADVTRQLAPDTYAIPDLRNITELTTSRKIGSAYPAFGNTTLGPPVRHYSAELHMGGNRDLFTTDPAGLPVYEGRMLDHFDHRAKTYDSGHGNSAVWIEREFGDPAKAIVPQWRVLRENIPTKLGDRCDRFRIAFGDVANPRNERSFISTLVPPGVICGHTVPTFIFDSDHEWAYLPWLAVANAFTMDAFVRRKLSSPHMTFTVLDSLPFPRPALTDSIVQSVAPVVLRLVCTAPEITPFWNRMATLGFVEAVAEGTVPPTALVEPNARATARAELDAFIAARVFNLTALELSDILDTFDVLRRRDEKAHGEFRTKKLILDAFATGAESHPPKQAAIPAPTWMDRALALPSSRRVSLTPDRYRATLVPHLLYQSGGSLPFERFRKAYWLLTEPKTLERYATGAVGGIAHAWGKTFRDKLEKDRFIEHLKGAVGRQLHFITKNGERCLELRDPKVADDEHIIFDARLSLLVADLWPVAEPITPLTPAEEIEIKQLEAVL